jgi:hypothetical protein
MFGAFISRIMRKSLIIFIFLTWYCFCIHLYVTIWMKLDPGMHISLHLVFFGKTGVTPPCLALARPRASTRKRICPKCCNRVPLMFLHKLANLLSLIHKHKVMIIIHKHGRLEFLPRHDLPHNSNSSLKVFNFSHAYFFASIGRFLWFSKINFLQ